MYFCLANYVALLRFARAQRHWPRRRRTLLQLALLLPLQTVIHGCFFTLDYLFYPRLWRQRVTAPVFIVGHARSGTTLMHRLMAGDGERFSFFRYWETFFPALTERALLRAAARVDARLLGGRLRRALEAWDEKTFGPWRHIHEQGLWLAEEDLFVLRAACIPQQWTLVMPVSHELNIFYPERLPARRRRRWLRHYRECVKRHLLAAGGQRTHLSKNPVMSGWVDALLEVFPDARFVVMVRDPAECIPSTLKLLEGSWRAHGWQPEDWKPAQAALLEISLDSYRLPAAALARRPAVPQCFVDYRELVAAPRATLDAVYRALQLGPAPAVAENGPMRRASGRRFTYALADFALTGPWLEAALAPFYQRYRWPRQKDARIDGSEGAEA